MITIEPSSFESHFNDFVNLQNLKISMQAIVENLKLENQKTLVRDLLDSLLESGLMNSFKFFEKIKATNDGEVFDALKLTDYSIEKHDSSLATTLDLLIALQTIKNELGQIENFCLHTHDQIPCEYSKDELKSFLISTPCSFGYDEDFYPTPC